MINTYVASYKQSWFACGCLANPTAFSSFATIIMQTFALKALELYSMYIFMSMWLGNPSRNKVPRFGVRAVKAISIIVGCRFKYFVTTNLTRYQIVPIRLLDMKLIWIRFNNRETDYRKSRCDRSFKRYKIGKGVSDRRSWWNLQQYRVKSS